MTDRERARIHASLDALLFRFYGGGRVRTEESYLRQDRDVPPRR